MNMLNDRYDVGFQASDVKKLREMLSKNGRGTIRREVFLSDLGHLLAVMKCSKGLSLQQLRVMMATAFDRFDLDADGNISETEFSAALSSCDIELRPSEIAVLLRFLSPCTRGGTIVAVAREGPGVADFPASLEDQTRRLREPV